MAGEAHVTFTGNLGADPELRFTPNGEAVASMRIAVTTRKKNQHGEWVDQDTAWYRVSAWRHDAEACAENLVKGDKVRVSGSLIPSIFQADSGPMLSLDVTADFNGVTKVLKPAKGHSPQPKTEDDPWG